MNDLNSNLVLDMNRSRSLNTASTISYILHLVVAIGAIIPGAQFGPLLLLVALVIDMVKRSDAAGTCMNRTSVGAFAAC